MTSDSDPLVLSVGSLNFLTMILLANNTPDHLLPPGSKIDLPAGPERPMSNLELVQEVCESADLDWREYCAGVIAGNPEARAAAVLPVCDRFGITEAEIEGNNEAFAELVYLICLENEFRRNGNGETVAQFRYRPPSH